MGVLRIVRFGTEFSFRTRRIFFFIIFFIALTGVTLYAMNEISRENTDLLMSQKTVVLQENSFFTSTASQTQTLASQFSKSAGTVFIVRYIYISSLEMKIFSINTKESWANTIVRPNEIREGSYISTGSDIGNNTFQALASRNQIPLGPVNGTQNINMTNTLSVNSVQKFTKGATEFNFKVVGLFDKKINTPKEENWVMLPDNAFDSLVSFLGLSPSQVYGYQVVIVANGYSETLAAALFGDSVKKVDANAIQADTVKGANFHVQDPPDITSIRSQATSTDLILIIGLIGSPIVATMYAFIISRFRTREMAVLKAVGYSNRNVQVMILTEIATVSVIGFLISAFGLQILLAMNSQYTLNTTYIPLIWNPFVSLVPSGTAILTFIFVVVSNIFGFVIISQRTIKVRPVELFKNVG